MLLYSLEAPCEALLISTHNICFRGEIRKNVFLIPTLIWRHGTYFFLGNTEISDIINTVNAKDDMQLDSPI